MANDYFALADLSVINDSNNSDIDVRDLLDDAPLLQRLAAVTASNGTLHKYVSVTGAPVVGFRSANDGREYDSTVRTQRSDTLEILDASFDVDIELARSYRGGPEELVRMEAIEHLRAAFFKLETQILTSGGGGGASGFTGFPGEATLDGLADAMVDGAGGTTALTSVYLIRTGDADCAVVAGNGGNITIGETVVIQKAGSGTGWYPALFTPISSYYGLQVGSIYSVGRIANLDAGSNTLTDDRIATAISNFPSSRPPNLIVMNRRSLNQLRDSRTATNATGAPAPFPSDSFGIPIIVTDALGNAETQVV